MKNRTEQMIKTVYDKRGKEGLERVLGVYNDFIQEGGQPTEILNGWRRSSHAIRKFLNNLRR